jgi:predicted nucleic-acid-binding protein
MIALDTNVVVRLLAADDKAQADQARALLAGQPVLISLTVLLETEWVLRSLYQFGPSDIANALERLAGLPNVTMEAEEIVQAALLAYKNGIDFADALHVCKSHGTGATAFATFDKRLSRDAKEIGMPIPVIQIS